MDVAAQASSAGVAVAVGSAAMLVGEHLPPPPPTHTQGDQAHAIIPIIPLAAPTATASIICLEDIHFT
jgi:hypothetical protein